jgi:formylglycine-generating enzyme required for sulfatase activity
MRGNVWEWVQDWYGIYPAGNVVDPSGPASGSRRVLHGGSWNYGAQHLRAAYRDGNDPSARFNSLGFRSVRTAAERR